MTLPDGKPFLPKLSGEPRRKGKCFKRSARTLEGEGGNPKLNICREALAKCEPALEINGFAATAKGETSGPETIRRPISASAPVLETPTSASI